MQWTFPLFDFPGRSLCIVICMNGSLLILKATKWFWIFSEELLSQSPLFYIIGSVVISLLTITVIDVMTALAEVSERESEERKDPNKHAPRIALCLGALAEHMV